MPSKYKGNKEGNKENKPLFNEEEMEKIKEILLVKPKPINMQKKSIIWWEEPLYTRKDFFEVNKSIYHKNNPLRTVENLLNMIKPKGSEFGHYYYLPEDLPKGFIPKGRIGDYLRRDETFYEEAKNALKQIKAEKEKTLIINYTGHGPSVAAALAEENIPIYWQIDCRTENIDPRLMMNPNMRLGEREINSLQDWVEIIAKNKWTNNKFSAIILESPHLIGDTTYAIRGLPTAKDLKEKGFKKVVIFTEEPIGKFNPKDTTVDDKFKEYIENLMKNGIKAEVIGIDREKTMERSKQK